MIERIPQNTVCIVGLGIVCLIILVLCITYDDREGR